MTDLRTELAQATEEIAAPPEDVFEALLEPEALERWFRSPDDGSTHDWEMDATPGGRWRARTVAPDGTEGVLDGDVVTIDAPHLLELRWHRAPGGASGSTVRFDLEPIWRDGERATRLTVTHVADSPLAARVLMASDGVGDAERLLRTLTARLVSILALRLSAPIVGCR